MNLVFICIRSLANGHLHGGQLTINGCRQLAMDVCGIIGNVCRLLVMYVD